MNESNVTTGSWVASELRARMNPGVSTVGSGVDDNAVWNQVPIGLTGAIVQVEKTAWAGTSVWIKPYQSTQITPEVVVASDYLFLAAEVEMRKLATYSNYALYYSKSISFEGSLYEYYAPIVPSDYVEWEGMAKRFGPAGQYSEWFCRSRSPNPGNTSTSFLFYDVRGGASHANSASIAKGVCPAFCL